MPAGNVLQIATVYSLQHLKSNTGYVTQHADLHLTVAILQTSPGNGGWTNPAPVLQVCP